MPVLGHKLALRFLGSRFLSFSLGAAVLDVRPHPLTQQGKQHQEKCRSKAARGGLDHAFFTAAGWGGIGLQALGKAHLNRQ